ncbi:dihydroneopterin aldolase [Natroniella sulfidigena]|uniref:dihydroneopterin aldolase n=1 Tax=Natroniella sulfidigena TaxID=723921 RepID=UPI00200A58F9|nr:dihydroneopterin aldolase [Natroniella sulfidigena]MCK8815812.1 dihydroneopterin aldolase [Natroniella sulfidigena]
MDKVILNNLAFYGYHGALNAENEIGQKFFIDLELYSDLRKAGKSDQLDDAINYAEVYELIKEIFYAQDYSLIEALAEDIASSILDDFLKIEEVMVRVKKPEAPVDAIFDHFGVEITRSRGSN